MTGTTAAADPTTARNGHHAHTTIPTLNDSLGQLAHLTRENADLRAQVASLPIIEQAKGILMGSLHLDADAAFALLRRWSSHTNTKLRELSRLLVDAASHPTRGQSSDEGSSALGRLLVDLQEGRLPIRTWGAENQADGRPATPVNYSRTIADLSAATEQDLLIELTAVEAAIARATAFQHSLDESGRAHVRVSDELIACADREHLIATELRQRRVGAAIAPTVLPADISARTDSTGIAI